MHPLRDSNLPPSPDANEGFAPLMLEDAVGARHNLTGRLIGSSSSYMPEHNHAPGRGPTTDTKWKCSHCRWFEIQIFLLSDKTYAVWTLGRSSLPNERTHHRLVQTPSAWEVVEILTVRKNPGAHNGEAVAFLPMPSARALSQASQFDINIREAYVNRAVA